MQVTCPGDSPLKKEAQETHVAGSHPADVEGMMTGLAPRWKRAGNCHVGGARRHV